MCVEHESNIIVYGYKINVDSNAVVGSQKYQPPVYSRLPSALHVTTQMKFSIVVQLGKL